MKSNQRQHRSDLGHASDVILCDTLRPIDRASSLQESPETVVNAIEQENQTGEGNRKDQEDGNTDGDQAYSYLTAEPFDWGWYFHWMGFRLSRW